MARTRNPKSKLSFGGLGLTKQEDERLKKMLKDRDYSIARLKRELIRDWMSTKVTK